MKRNLVLEAQVAELRVEKVEKIHPSTSPTSSSISVPGLPGPSFSAAMAPSPGEPRPGSWEKAFRTPLEAGPPMPKIRKSGVSDAPFQNETGLPPPRIEAKPLPSVSANPPLIISEKSPVSSPDVDDKFSERPMVVSSASAWEDSPKFVGESTGVLTPSASSKRDCWSDESEALVYRQAGASSHCSSNVSEQAIDQRTTSSFYFSRVEAGYCADHHRQA